MQPASDPKLLARLARLELRARTAVEGLQGGRHRSRARGSSSTFAQHREYAPGDDPRRLDWKLLARTDRPIVREYEEETSLTLWLLLDASESMRFGSLPWSKWDYATWLAAALARVAVDQQDRIGLVTLRGAEATPGLHAAAGEAHWAAMVAALETAQPGGAGDPGLALEHAATRMDRRGIVVWITDCLGSPEQAAHGVARLRHTGHDLIVLRVLDPAEIHFPYDRITQFEGLESAERLRLDPRAVRDAYLEEFEAHGRELRRRLRGLGCDFRRMPTDEPLEAGLVEFLARRGARLRRMSR